jgi:hypothetical protein
VAGGRRGFGAGEVKGLIAWGILFGDARHWIVQVQNRSEGLLYRVLAPARSGSMAGLSNASLLDSSHLVGRRSVDEVIDPLFYKKSDDGTSNGDDSADHVQNHFRSKYLMADLVQFCIVRF